MQREYNWLLTNLEVVPLRGDSLPGALGGPDPLWLSGEELSQLVESHDLQFAWGVLSGFAPGFTANVHDLQVYPFADTNVDLWVGDPPIQHPEALVEIVCFDSSATLLLSRDREPVLRFRAYFPEAVDLGEYNRRAAVG